MELVCTQSITKSIGSSDQAAMEFQLFFFRGNQPASQAMPPTRARIPKIKAQSKRTHGTFMTASKAKR